MTRTLTTCSSDRLPTIEIEIEIEIERSVSKPPPRVVKPLPALRFKPAPGIQSGSYPFSMGEGDSVSLHLHNAGDEPQTFRSVIKHADGQFIFPEVRLEPGASWQRDLGDLAAGEADLLGRTLPSDFRAGRFIWINDDPEGTLFGRLRVIEAGGTAYGLSCAICPCWTDQWSDVWDGVKLVGTTGPFGPTEPFRRAVPKSGVLSATTHRLNVCPGGGTTDVAADVTEWSVQAPSGTLTLSNTIGTPVQVSFKKGGTGGILCGRNAQKLTHPTLEK